MLNFWPFWSFSIFGSPPGPQMKFFWIYICFHLAQSVSGSMVINYQSPKSAKSWVIRCWIWLRTLFCWLCTQFCGTRGPLWTPFPWADWNQFHMHLLPPCLGRICECVDMKSDPPVLWMLCNQMLNMAQSLISFFLGAPPQGPPGLRSVEHPFQYC